MVPNSAGGLGGAIYVKNVIVDILHVTFNDNVAFGALIPTTSGKAGSAIFADLGSAVTLEDTLVDDTNNLANPAVNPGSSELLDAAFASGILSAGANLVHDSSWMNVANWNTRNNDISNGNQDLTPLQFNQPTPGRPAPTFTETYALVGGAGEQAIGAGDDVGQALDQNGRSRPFGLPIRHRGRAVLHVRSNPGQVRLSQMLAPGIFMHWGISFQNQAAWKCSR